MMSVSFFLSQTGPLRPFYPDTIRRMILLASAEITDYQVVQKEPGQLEIALSIASGAAFAQIALCVQESVQRIVARYDCRPALVRIEQGITPIVAGTKRRRVQVVRT